MKISSNHFIESELRKKFNTFTDLLINYELDRLDVLGDIALTIVMFDEYWSSNIDNSNLKPKYFIETYKYISSIYKEQKCLCLKQNNNYYLYSRNNILKMARGLKYHADGKKLDEKKSVLRNFIFEDSNTTYEMILTVQYLMMPGTIMMSTGNLDSSGVMVNLWDPSGTVHEITAIEACILNIADEFFNICNYGKFPSRNRTVFPASFEYLNELMDQPKAAHAHALLKWYLAGMTLE